MISMSSVTDYNHNQKYIDSELGRMIATDEKLATVIITNDKMLAKKHLKDFNNDYIAL